MSTLGDLFGGALDLFGSNDAADAAKQAADVQAQYAQEGVNYNTGQAQQVRSDFAPSQYVNLQGLTTYRNALGLGGPAASASALSQFQQSPGYQYQLQQGVKGLDMSAAARGGLYSGQQGQDLTTYGQGLANQDFGNWENRLQGLATNYQTGAAQQGALGAQFATNVTNGLDNIGAAKASGIVGAANAQSQGLQGLAGFAGQALSNPGTLAFFGL